MTSSPVAVGSASPRPSWPRTCAAAVPAYVSALAELRAGRKRSHWIWFVFPQIDGLGSSPTARRYAIRSLDEARAYLADDVLGPRLRESCEALLALDPVLVAALLLLLHAMPLQANIESARGVKRAKAKSCKREVLGTLK